MEHAAECVPALSAGLHLLGGSSQGSTSQGKRSLWLWEELAGAAVGHFT